MLWILPNGIGGFPNSSTVPAARRAFFYQPSTERPTMTSEQLAKYKAACKLANDLLAEHATPEWGFVLDRAKRRRGCCNYTKKQVSISRHLLDDPWESIENTIRHEIAHVIAGSGAGHGPKWRAAARSLGIKPKRCGEKMAAEIEYRYTVLCTSCGTKWSRHRIARSYRAKLARCRCSKCKAMTIEIVDSRATPLATF